MGIQPGQRERRRLAQVAREYEERGYRVWRMPTDEQLPEFLCGTQPDLIAVADDDRVVLEVKTSKTMNQEPRLTDIAEKVGSIEGWRFELVVTNPRVKSELEEDDEVLDTWEISARLDDAQKLLDAGHYPAAFFMAWTAWEARLRQIVAASGKRIYSLSPLGLIKTAFSLGHLDREQYEFTERLCEWRNKLIHGYRSEQVSPKQIRKLIHLTQKME